MGGFRADATVPRGTLRALPLVVNVFSVYRAYAIACVHYAKICFLLSIPASSSGLLSPSLPSFLMQAAKV